MDPIFVEKSTSKEVRKFGRKIVALQSNFKEIIPDVNDREYEVHSNWLDGYVFGSDVTILADRLTGIFGFLVFVRLISILLCRPEHRHLAFSSIFVGCVK